MHARLTPFQHKRLTGSAHWCPDTGHVTLGERCGQIRRLSKVNMRGSKSLAWHDMLGNTLVWLDQGSDHRWNLAKLAETNIFGLNPIT